MQNLGGSTVQDAPEGQNRMKNIEHEKIENLPAAIAFPLGLVSPNIQANERAMTPMNPQNNASNFLTPKFSRNRKANLHVLP